MSARRRRRDAGRALEASRRTARRAPYDEVRGDIQTGDLLFYRGRTMFSRLIRRLTRSVYSHVAIAAWWSDHLVVFESRGRGGVTVKPLRRAIGRYDAQIDWWSLRADLAAKLDRKRLLNLAVAELGKPYGWGGVASLGWQILLGRLTGGTDAVGAPEAHFCSQYVSRCFREAGVDLAPDAPDALTSPGALVRAGTLELRAVLRR